MTKTNDQTQLLGKFQVKKPLAIVDLGSTSNEMPLPDGYEPREVDILCGRGKGSYNRAGHKRYLAVVEALFPKFMSAKTRIDKSNVFDEIIAEVQSERFGCAKFIKSVNKKWVEISKDEARGKVGHALRVMKAELLQRAKASKGTKQTGCKSKSAAKQSNAAIPKKINIPSKVKSSHSNKLISENCRLSRQIERNQENQTEYMPFSVFNSSPTILAGRVSKTWSGPGANGAKTVSLGEEDPQTSSSWTDNFEAMQDCEEISCVTLEDTIKYNGNSPQINEHVGLPTLYRRSAIQQHQSVPFPGDLVPGPHYDELSFWSLEDSVDTCILNDYPWNQQLQHKDEIMPFVPSSDVDQKLPTLPLTGILYAVPHFEEIDYDSIF